MLGWLFYITRGEESDRTSAARFLCASCRQWLADSADQLEVMGRPIRRVYVNPHGIECEIITLADCHDVVLSSFSTMEHTWFVGYAWRPLVCGGCGSHLGWRFEAEGAVVGPDHFYGVLVDRLLLV